MSDGDQPVPDRQTRLRRICRSVTLVVVTSIVAFGSWGVVPAQAYTGTCTLRPPDRLALWGSFTDLTVRVGDDCRVPDGRQVGWIAEIATDKGPDARVAWSTGAPRTQTVRVSDSIILAGYPWARLQTHDDAFPELNVPWTTIKLGSVGYVAASRSGGYHEVVVRGYHYSPSAARVVPSGNREGQLQFRTPGSTAWQPVAVLRLAPDGRSVVRTWSPGPREYRVSFGEQRTLFATISATVSAR